MLNQSVKEVEKAVNGTVSKSMADASHTIDQLRAGLTETAEATMGAVRSEVNHLSRASREVASKVGAEVVRRPLTYTIAAVGAGALVGIGLMAILNRPRN